MPHTPTIAVDIAKSVFEIAVSHEVGKVAQRHRVGRDRFFRFFAKRQSATVLLEASSSAHHWARALRELGHQPVLLPPKDVRPYRRSNKTDRADAKALLEAHRDEDLRPVPVKSVHQQTLTSLHRLRSAWLAARTARSNTVRGILREPGHTIPLGARHVVPRSWALLEDAEARVPDPCASPSPRPASRSAISNSASLPSSSSYADSLARSQPSRTCRASRGSVSSPLPPWSPSSATSDAFPPGATSPATSASHRENTRAAPGDGSEESPSGATPTCACS